MMWVDGDTPYYAPTLAFPVYHVGCLSGSVWMHELGHAMGCLHDRYSGSLNNNDITLGGNFYAYGNCWEDTSVKTGCVCYKSVMTYDCNTVPHGCTSCSSRDLLSNYNVINAGSPTGLQIASCGTYIDTYRYTPIAYRKSIYNGGIIYSISPNIAMISKCTILNITGWMIGYNDNGNGNGGQIISVIISGVSTVILSQSLHHVMVLTPNVTKPNVLPGDVIVTTTGNRVSILKSAFKFIDDNTVVYSVTSSIAAVLPPPFESSGNVPWSNTKILSLV